MDKELLRQALELARAVIAHTAINYVSHGLPIYTDDMTLKAKALIPAIEKVLEIK